MNVNFDPLATSSSLDEQVLKEQICMNSIELATPRTETSSSTFDGNNVMYLLDIKSYIHLGAECNCPVAMTTLYRWNSYVFRTVCIWNSHVFIRH